MKSRLQIGKNKINVNGALIGLLLICVIFSFATPAFLKGYNIMNIARQCSINLIVAVGMTFIILTGGIDLSVGGILALVGTIVAGLIAGGMPVALAVILGLLLGAAFGVFNGICVSYAQIPPFITTMATLSIARSIALIYSGGYPITGMPKSFTFLGTGSIGIFPVPVVIAVCIVIFGVFVLRKTVLGKYIYAIGGNEDATRLSGINVNVWKLVTYGIHGILTGIAGVVLTARMNSGQPSAASGIELDIIAAVVIGGTSLSGGEGGIAGTVIGTLVITVLNNGLTLMDVNPYLQGLIIGFVILISVFIDKKKSK
ncbi:MAG: ABC transporter permease [Blautia sp.]|jgi:ribose transport system permease protein